MIAATPPIIGPQTAGSTYVSSFGSRSRISATALLNRRTSRRNMRSTPVAVTDPNRASPKDTTSKGIAATTITARTAPTIYVISRKWPPPSCASVSSTIPAAFRIFRIPGSGTRHRVLAP